jgi:methylated-DNA-[protein]-cysteine S-methyltransferase
VAQILPWGLGRVGVAAAASPSTATAAAAAAGIGVVRVRVHSPHPHLRAARQWLDSYWSGGNPSSTALQLDWQGTAFQATVWRALLGIPLGQTCSYGDLAARLQPPSAPRATGGAIGRNPLAVLVPCHRVVGADGSLTGYASGLAIKQLLLRHEGVLPR